MKSLSFVDWIFSTSLTVIKVHLTRMMVEATSQCGSMGSESVFPQMVETWFNFSSEDPAYKKWQPNLIFSLENPMDKDPASASPGSHRVDTD